MLFLTGCGPEIQRSPVIIIFPSPRAYPALNVLRGLFSKKTGHACECFKNHSFVFSPSEMLLFVRRACTVQIFTLQYRVETTRRYDVEKRKKTRIVMKKPSGYGAVIVINIVFSRPWWYIIILLYCDVRPKNNIIFTNKNLIKIYFDSCLPKRFSV